MAMVHGWQSLGLTGIIALALAFAFGAMLYIPRFSLYLAGGLLFGFVALPAAVIGTTVGAVLAFLLARHALRGAFLRRVEAQPKWQATLAAIDAEGWRLVALTRLASPLPGGAINYLFGLTRIGLAPYAAGTAVGLLPPVALFVALGALGRMALADMQQPWGQGVAVLTGLMVLAIAIFLVLRRVMATLPSRAPGSGRGSALLD